MTESRRRRQSRQVEWVCGTDDDLDLLAICGEADVLGVDVAAAVTDKLAINEGRFTES